MVRVGAGVGLGEGVDVGLGGGVDGEVDAGVDGGAGDGAGSDEATPAEDGRWVFGCWVTGSWDACVRAPRVTLVTIAMVATIVIDAPTTTHVRFTNR